MLKMVCQAAVTVTHKVAATLARVLFPAEDDKKARVAGDARERSDRLREDMEQLDRELRRRGHLPRRR